MPLFNRGLKACNFIKRDPNTCSFCEIFQIFKNTQNTSGGCFLSGKLEIFKKFPEEFLKWKLYLLKKYMQWENSKTAFFSTVILRINPSLTNVPILYPLKKPENQRFSCVFRGNKIGTLTRNGLKSYNFELQ